MRIFVIALAGLGACAVLPTRPGGGSDGDWTPVPPLVEAHPWVEGLRLPHFLRRPPLKEEELIVEDVETLLAGDFSSYPAAAQRLVADGEIAVPYLGHAAGHFEAPAQNKLRIAIALDPILESMAPAHVGFSLDSPYASVRIAAATCTGDRRLTEHASRLVELLDDPDVEVRRASVTALRKISNVFYGYRPEDTRRRRRKAVARWRGLWGGG